MLAVARRQETLVGSPSKCTEEYFCVKPASRGASGSRAAFPVAGARVSLAMSVSLPWSAVTAILFAILSNIARSHAGYENFFRASRSPGLIGGAASGLGTAAAMRLSVLRSV